MRLICVCIARTTRKDEDGNLISVKSTGNEEESSDYEDGNLLTLRTGGNGTYTYDYDEKHNGKQKDQDRHRQEAGKVFQTF